MNKQHFMAFAFSAGAAVVLLAVAVASDLFAFYVGASFFVAAGLLVMWHSESQREGKASDWVARMFANAVIIASFLQFLDGGLWRLVFAGASLFLVVGWASAEWKRREWA